MANPTKAGRPAKWSGPTRAIRVPDHLADHLLTIARQLDNPDPANNVQNPTDLPICAPLPPYLLTSSSAKGAYHYTVNPPPDIPVDVWAEADRLVEEVCGPLSQKERWLMLGRLVEEWGQNHQNLRLD